MNIYQLALSIAFAILATQGLIQPNVLADSPPNVVIILADDMGWGDPQCYQSESKIPTPNLDRLAAEGMRFTDAHTPSSVCTPTRYTLLTGRYCWRTSLKKGVLDGFGPPLIEQDDVTLASMLKDAGYRTACVGKWHIGMEWFDKDGMPMGERGPQRFRPGDNVDFERDITGGPCDVGFDSYFGISASLDMSPYAYIRDRRVETLPTEWHDEIDGTIFLNGVSGVKSPGFDIHDVLGRFGDEAVLVIEKSQSDDRPFFLYMPLNSPHLPIAPSDDAKAKSNAGDYGDFVWDTDRTVGRVLDALDDIGASDNTLVLFTSDNGGLWHWWDFHADDDGGKIPLTPRAEYVKRFGHRSNAALRGTKADIFEGGHRVPFLVRWPAKIAANQTCDALVELTDVFATVAEITNHPLQQNESGMDGFSFLSVLTGNAKTTRTFSVHHSLAGVFALRQGAWKMIEGRGSGGFTQPRRLQIKQSDPRGQLYDLANDPQEKRNQWHEHPERIEAMKRKLDAVRDSSARDAAAP